MKQRNCNICNIKALLLFCVILGHGIERDIAYDTAAANLYRLLYLFHMPLFAFVSGLGAKNIHVCLHQARQIGKQYLCTQMLILLGGLLVQPDTCFIYFICPYWHLWYLLSLASWYLLAASVYRAFEHSGRKGLYTKQGMLLLALTAGLLAGYFPLIGRIFSLSRTLVFFPFFLAGALWGQIIIDWVSRAYWLLPLALLIVIVCYFFTAKLPVSFLYQAEGYSAFGFAGLSGIKFRLVCYIAAIACSVLILLLCPKGKCVLTPLGGDTLMPYLLHPIFIKSLEFIPYSPQYAVLVSFFLSLATVFSIHLCFKWRHQLFFYTDKRKKGRRFWNNWGLSKKNPNRI